MKHTVIALFLITGLSFGMGSKTDCPGQSSNLPDKLILKTKQVKGPGLMYYMAGINDLRFQILDSLKFNVILPDNIHDIQIAVELADYNTYGYERTIKAGNDTSLLLTSR